LKKTIKKLSAILLTAAIAMTLISLPAPDTQAVKFGDVAGVPQAFWAVFVPYEDALNARDSAGIITHGEHVINYWLAGRTAEQRAAEWGANVPNHGYEINMMWSASYTVARQYEARKDYVNATRLYKIALAFVDPYKALIPLSPGPGGSISDMDFARTEIQTKIDAWNANIELYVEIDMRNGVGDTSFTGALHEPKMGIFYGEPPEASAVMDFAKKPSGTLIYVRYETQVMSERVQADLAANESRHGYSRSDYSVIELAWNFHEEGATLKTVPNDTAKITAAAQYLNSLGLPILLRIGAEMNVWRNSADPAEYIAAYRFIADIMRKEAPNVALVWSVNHVSAAGLTYEMFYPGERYVDWVGISMYVRRYFQGNPNTSSSDEAIWGTGSFANPIKDVESIVKLYGSKHPIIIVEGGVTLFNTSNNEDLTDWALPRIRQLYAYVPMLFPQVKAIFWFNTNIQGHYRYDFADSPRAKELYRQLTGSGYFLGMGQTEPTVTYKKIGTATMPANAVTLLTYAPFFTFDDVVVQYWLDGKWVGQSADIPYRFTRNFSTDADGAYKLEVRVLSGSTVLKSAEYNIRKNGNNVTIATGAITPPPPPPAGSLTVNPTQSTVYVNGKATEFEAYLINGSNFFKLRDLAYVINGTTKQFEVGYNAATGEVTLTAGQPYTTVVGDMVLGDGSAKTATLNTTLKVSLNGTPVEITAYLIGGNNFVRLRDIMKLVNVETVYDETTRAIWLDTSKPYID